MNSRRSMASLRREGHFRRLEEYQIAALALCPWSRRSQCPLLGQKQTSAQVRAMSALPPKADMDQHGRDVRFGAKSRHSTLIRLPRRRGRAALTERLAQ